MGQAKRKKSAGIRNNNELNLDLRDVGAKGRGLIAKRDFVKGSLIATYIGDYYKSWGEIIRLARATDNDDDRNRFCNYPIHYNDGCLLPSREDMNRVGAHLANHSCNPSTLFGKNCSLIAHKNIKRGEEVTVHYGWTGNKECLCADELCTGIIGIKREIECAIDPTQPNSRHGVSTSLDIEHLHKTIQTAIRYDYLSYLIGTSLEKLVSMYPDVFETVNYVLYHYGSSL